MRNFKYFFLKIFILVNLLIAGCSDSNPTVTSCTSATSSTAASLTGLAACGSLTSTSASLTGGNTFEIKNPIDPYIYSAFGFYIPHNYNESDNEGVLRKDPSINLPADSKFHADKPFTYVLDESLEAMDIINEILCKITQTQYEDMINIGPFKSLVNTNKCKFGYLSGSSAPAFELLTVDSTKSDNDSPLIVKVWIHQEADLTKFKPQAIIEVILKITSESKLLSSKIQNLYGISKMSYKAYSKESKDLLYKGYLKTEHDDLNNHIVKFYNYGDFNIASDSRDIFVKYDARGVLKRKYDETFGSGTIIRDDIFDDLINTKTYNITYNSSHFLREESNSDTMCLSMKDSSVFAGDYRLYLNENSKNPGALLNDALVQVTDLSHNENEGIYTFNLSDDRLTVIEKYELDLFDIKNIPFTYYDENSDERFKISWDGISFKIFKEFDTASGLSEQADEYSLDFTELNKPDLTLWSDSLGANINITLDNCIANENNTLDCSDFHYYNSIVTVETSSSGLNKLSFLKDIYRNNYLEFDPPKNISYVHYQPDASKSDNKYHDTTFLLRYSLYGGLFGLPGRCIDTETGGNVNCLKKHKNTKSIFYVNEFNLPDGFKLSNDFEFYYVKALKRTEIMKHTNLYNCFESGLTATTTNNLPDDRLWEDPNLGDEPLTLLSPVVVERIR